MIGRNKNIATNLKKSPKKGSLHRAVILFFIFSEFLYRKKLHSETREIVIKNFIVIE